LSTETIYCDIGKSRFKKNSQRRNLAVGGEGRVEGDYGHKFGSRGGPLIYVKASGSWEKGAKLESCKLR